MENTNTLPTLTSVEQGKSKRVGYVDSAYETNNMDLFVKIE